MVEVVLKQRDTAIDFVKAIAAIMVINSHMQICYPGHEYLATGGSIGDALFFFASGFALFLGRKMDFINWYKRRIGRIIPTMIAMGLIACLVFQSDESFLDIMLARRYWFLQCILVLYIFFYPVIKHPAIINKVGLSSLALFIILYFCFFNYESNGLYYGTDNVFRWVAYFPIMLMGGVICINKDKIKYRWFSLPLLLICIFGWYGTLYLFGRTNLYIISYIPFVGIPFFAYMVGKAPFITHLYERKWIGNILYILGSICLECYLIQYFIFTDKLNGIFPLNVPIIIISVIISAYLLHALGNLLSQVFDSKLFEWRTMFIYKK